MSSVTEPLTAWRRGGVSNTADFETKPVKHLGEVFG